MDYTALDLLRQNHPAWRLLRSEHAPLLASFLQRVFIVPDVRTISQAELAEAREDELYGLREQLGADAFPRSGTAYLNDWAPPSTTGRLPIAQPEHRRIPDRESQGGRVSWSTPAVLRMLAEAEWLTHRQLIYWGDIDTLGYAILDQLRARLPHVTSLLMDSATLLAHRGQWSTESKPLSRDLPRLDRDEAEVYDVLRNMTPGRNVRLEQEMINYGWLQRRLGEL